MAEQKSKTSNSKLTEEQKAAENTALDAAPLTEARREQKEGTVEDDFVATADRVVSAVALDPTLVESVGAAIGLAPGDSVTLTYGGRQVSGRIVQVHPGNPANPAIGLEEIKPTVDVKAFTGNPNTGGHELLYGIPVNDVRAVASV